MSHSSTLHIQLQEAEANKTDFQMEKTTNAQANAELEAYQAKLKAEKEAFKEANKPQLIGVGNMPALFKGIPEKITPIKSRFGYSWRIEMNGTNFYYNSKLENGIEKVFSVGTPCIFSCEQQANKRNPEKPYLIIKTVYYTF